MKRSTKAALLSALVLPGSGHIFLKKYIAGCILAGMSLAGLYYLASRAIEQALQIAEKIQAGSLPLDPGSVLELISKQPTQIALQRLSIATSVFIIIWLISIIDSYRIGYMQERRKTY